MLKFPKVLQGGKRLRLTYLLSFSRNNIKGIPSLSALLSSRTSQLLDSQTRSSRRRNMSQGTSLMNSNTDKVSGNELNYNEHIMKLREGLNIVDVRNPDEIETNGKVQGALEIPLPMLKEEFGLSSEVWGKKYKRQKPNLDAQIMLICASGVRSKVGVKVLKELGYKNLFSYKGGYTNLKEQK